MVLGMSMPEYQSYIGITGTDDNAYILHETSLIIAGKIPEAWLIQIENTGHAVMSQYPGKINKILQHFYRRLRPNLNKRHIETTAFKIQEYK